MDKHQLRLIDTVTSPRRVSDIDEVSYLRMYSNRVAAKAPAPEQSERRYPLVDMVTPQPKAFFAYLRMPKKASRHTKSQASSSTGRIKRQRKTARKEK